MKLKGVEETCCADETGDRLAFHLCCPDCRRELAQEERARLMDLGTAPDGCSAEIPMAPARGPLVRFREGYWHETDGQVEWRQVPYRSGCAGRTQDVFDIMTDQTVRRGGDAPFTVAQVGAGRDYRALHERVKSAGVKCSRAFDVQTIGQGGNDFMTSYMRDTKRLAMFHEAIGDGVAKDTRRKVAATCGSVKVGDVQLRQIDRRLITMRRLVDDFASRNAT